MNECHMTISAARAAIEAILAAIPDDELPDFDRVEVNHERGPCVWWGSTGHHLGSAKSGGVRDPLVYRRNASWNAIESEMTYRADKRLLENGDDPAGVRLAEKVTTS